MPKVKISTMTASQLEDHGLAKYGKFWQTPLAKELRVSDRTMRRYASGEMPIPQAIADRLVIAKACPDKWLIGAGASDRRYLIHTASPQFLVRLRDGNAKFSASAIIWLGQEPGQDKARNSLMEEATAFLEQISN